MCWCLLKQALLLKCCCSFWKPILKPFSMQSSIQHAKGLPDFPAGWNATFITNADSDGTDSYHHKSHSATEGHSGATHLCFNSIQHLWASFRSTLKLSWFSSKRWPCLNNVDSCGMDSNGWILQDASGLWRQPNTHNNGVWKSDHRSCY